MTLAKNLPFSICLIVLALFSTGTSFAGPATPTPPVTLGEMPKIPGAHSFYIKAPVFGSKVFVYEAGKRNPVTLVLVHGLGDLAASDWSALIPELARTYHILTFDLPGFGHSEKQNARYDPPRYAQFVEEMVQRYAHRRVFLAGHSMGGAIALYLATMRPERFEKLLLIDVAGVIDRTSMVRHMAALRGGNALTRSLLKPLFGSINNIAGSLLGAVEMERSEEDINTILNSPEARQTLLNGDPARIAPLGLINTNFSNRLDRPKMPTLVLWGEHDDVAPVRTGWLLHYRLPDALLKIIKGAGHVPMKQATATVLASIKDFFEEGIQRVAVTAPAPSAREGRCLGENGKVFQGAYKTIYIKQCKNVVLRDVYADLVDIVGSEVLIKDSHFVANDTALRTLQSEVALEGGSLIGNERGIGSLDSTVTATGTTISGNHVAVQVRQSQLDLAGVELVSPQLALKSDAFSTFRASVTRYTSALGSDWLHGPVPLAESGEM